MNTTLEAMGHALWTEDEARKRIALSMREAFPKLFGEAWEEAADIFYRAFAEVHIDMLRPLPGAEELIEGAAADGIVLAVVSNKTGHYLRQEAEHLGWSKHFHRIVGAGDAARDKPATDVVDLALSGSGIATVHHTVWFVGDMPVDMECARESGCRPILLRATEPDMSEFANCVPDIHLPGADALLEHVREQTVSNARV